MIHRLTALVFLAILAVDPVSACPPPSDTLLFHSCWGQGHLAVRLLPEDLPLPEPTNTVRRLTVTGAYTSRETRNGGRPKPVGMFVHEGTITNPNLGRMDGILLVDPVTGKPELHHRARLRFGNREFDLRSLDQRRAFLSEVAVRGLSVLQSHLLIAEGRVDVRWQDGAPVFVRRMLFTDENGFGLYQTLRRETLQDAAKQLAGALAPRMALNLDMGSYNYCQLVEDGAETGCGGLGRDDTGKLSNLLVLTLK